LNKGKSADCGPAQKGTKVVALILEGGKCEPRSPGHHSDCLADGYDVGHRRRLKALSSRAHGFLAELLFGMLLLPPWLEFNPQIEHTRFDHWSSLITPQLPPAVHCGEPIRDLPRPEFPGAGDRHFFETCLQIIKRASLLLGVHGPLD
jgi:hypothetical protein